MLQTIDKSPRYSETISRLTDKTYLRQRRSLRQLWLQRAHTFSRVPISDQRVIHDFYLPGGDASDGELLEHRRIVTAEQPSLPNRAGKALRRLDPALKPSTPSPSSRRRNRVAVGALGRDISVRAVLRPEPDIVRLASAFMSVATQIEEAEAVALRATQRDAHSEDEAAPRSPEAPA